MKRIYIAIFLIILSLFFATTEYILISKNCEFFSENLDIAEQHCSNNEFTKAFDSIKQTQKEWDKKSKALNSFIDQTHTQNVNDCLFELLETAKNNDSKQFLSLCHKTKRQLLSIKESELPCFENIL